MRDIFHSRTNYQGIIYVKGHPLSVSDFKLGGKNDFTDFENKKILEYIKHYNL